MTYTLYCLNRTGDLTSVDVFEVDTDEEAIALARSKQLPARCELWEGTRLVDQIATHLIGHADRR